ncbi:MAG: histone deacetylase [Methanolinea sp.]|nr:histone deacetylase [Methanolinea sp.]
MRARCSVITGGEFARHDLGLHEENARRLQDALAAVPPHVRVYPPQPASFEDLARVHEERHIRMLEELCSYGGRRYLDLDTYVTEDSFRVATLAAGAAIGAVGRALGGEPCFALVRPPGHHAEPCRAMGYCLFNNAAVAAAWALERVERVAIVDWDLHHGNGTQKIFYGTDRVLFCSIHQADIFPWTGWIDEVGEGRGRGFTLNAPLPAGAGIADYHHVFSTVFCEALAHFEPDALIVSAGFDPLHDDPKGGMRLHPRDFAVLCSLLREAASCPPALVLEGGYGPSLGEAVRAVLEILGSDEACPCPPGLVPRASTARIARLLRKVMF